jgi:hypothetical protein
MVELRSTKTGLSRRSVFFSDVKPKNRERDATGPVMCAVCGIELASMKEMRRHTK